MSLVSFHRALIVTAILFCFGFAGWEVRAWLSGGGSGAVALAAIFTALGALLIVYLVRLASILKLKE